jgi:ATP-binding cassette subfamily B protein
MHMKELIHSLPQFLWQYGKRYKWRLSALIFTVLLWSINVSLTPYLLKLLIDRAMLAETLGEDFTAALFFPAFFYVLAMLVTSLSLRAYDWIWMRILPNLKNSIIEETFALLQKYPLSYFQQNFSGGLGNKIQELAKGSSLIIHSLTDQITARIFSFSIAFIVMGFVHPLCAVLLIFWSFIFLGSFACLFKKSQQHAESASQAANHAVGKSIDAISNIFIIKSYAREKHECLYLQKALKESAEKEKTWLCFLMKIKTFYAGSMALLFIGLLWILIHAKNNQLVTVGDFALTLTLAATFVRDMLLMTNHLMSFSEQVGICKQALSLFSQPLSLSSPTTHLQVSQGEIVFHRVSFSYQNKQSLFREKSMIIPARSKVGIVGLSGSGKTTLTNLILRLFETSSGKILIDGQDISQVTPESLRNQIALIPQEPFLFHRSFLENIRYGRLDATDEEVIECAKKANCHEFIESLPQGYHSLVGERGVKLSGGQKQRISIARAMLKNAPILILDEATSALDSATEKEIQKSLSYLMEGKTTIVIAHRLSTLSHLDRIFVLQGGAIIEEGTHQQLLSNLGLYHRLWQAQIH